MIEKRFQLAYSAMGTGMFVDIERQFEDIIVDKKFPKTGLIKIHNVLNELAKENEELKEENKELRQYLDWHYMELEEMEDCHD